MPAAWNFARAKTLKRPSRPFLSSHHTAIWHTHARECVHPSPAVSGRCAARRGRGRCWSPPLLSQSHRLAAPTLRPGASIMELRDTRVGYNICSEFRPCRSRKIFTPCTAEGGTLTGLDKNDNSCVMSYSLVRICCDLVRRLIQTSFIVPITLRRTRIGGSERASSGGTNTSSVRKVTSRTDDAACRFDN